MPELCVARRCTLEAELGLLCGRDGRRLADHYGAREGHGAHALPWMWTNLAHAYPSLSGWAAASTAHNDIDDPEAEKLTAVLDLRNAIGDHLTNTALDLAERLGRHGPNLLASDRLRVQRAAAWLLTHIDPLRGAQGLPPALAGPAVARVLGAADDLASRAHALAPWRPSPTRLDGIPCRCGAKGGTIHDHGDTKTCHRCGWSFDDTEWAALMHALADLFRDHQETSR